MGQPPKPPDPWVGSGRQEAREESAPLPPAARPSPPGNGESQKILAALAYLFPLALVLGVYERLHTSYFLRYHVAQALLVNISSILLFLSPIALAMAVPRRPLSVWPLGLQMILGVGLSVLLLTLFGLHLYCMAQAYLGRYTVLPGITTWTYAWLERWGG